jgi:hypothetical protein
MGTNARKLDLFLRVRYNRQAFLLLPELLEQFERLERFERFISYRYVVNLLYNCGSRYGSRLTSAITS